MQNNFISLMHPFFQLYISGVKGMKFYFICYSTSIHYFSFINFFFVIDS